MVAARLRARENRIDCDNVVEVSPQLSLLRSAIIYGANASGKSNLVYAARFVRSIVVGTAGLTGEFGAFPFLLDDTGAASPSSFEVVFLLEGKQYRYGFSLLAQKVIEEWLYCVPSTREVQLFRRDATGVRIGKSFPEGRGLSKFSLENKLILSVVAEYKQGPISRRVREWFEHAFRPVRAVTDEEYFLYTRSCIEQGAAMSEKIQDLVRKLDVDITSLNVETMPLPPDAAAVLDAAESVWRATGASGGSATEDQTGAAAGRMLVRLKTGHSVRDVDGRETGEKKFPAGDMESDGTLKLISLAGPLVDVLENGRVLILDEIDSRLHPLMTSAIIALFNSPQTNPHGAQLICTTHNTDLLNANVFRRDQIYFVEKDRRAVSGLYSLADFKEHASGGARTVRSDASFEKDYIRGRYGAIPYTGGIQRFFSATDPTHDPKAAGSRDEPER